MSLIKILPKTKKGKNRVSQYGNIWTAFKFGEFNGHPAVLAYAGEYWKWWLLNEIEYERV